jgi:sugar lactone lactonase YvrE
MPGISQQKNSAIRRMLAGLVIACLMAVPMKAAASLKLFAEHAGKRFEKFEVSNGAIVIDGLASDADGVVWRLEGDLKQEHQAVLFDPYYNLVARVAIPGLACKRPAIWRSCRWIIAATGNIVSWMMR